MATRLPDNRFAISGRAMEGPAPSPISPRLSPGSVGDDKDIALTGVTRTSGALKRPCGMSVEGGERSVAAVAHVAADTLVWS
jgi:hypothetical protein